jgi:hypothetical protein
MVTEHMSERPLALLERTTAQIATAELEEVEGRSAPT